MTEDELILTHILRCSREELVLNKPTLDPLQQSQYKDLKERRSHGEPLQYLLGQWDFYGFDLAVDPRVLIPRPETERLVEVAVKCIKGVDILDLGTGSGNIAVSLACLLPYAKITTVDISVDALEVALSNAQAHGVESRIDFCHEDMGVFLGQSRGAFDLIISNPPYIPTDQISLLPKDVQMEPRLALDGGADGLDFYRLIINKSPRLLRSGGYLMMEFGDGQGPSIRSMAQNLSVFSNIELISDLAGKERIIMCQI